MAKRSHHKHGGLLQFDAKTRSVNVVIESPRGVRNKYKHDEKRDLFKLDDVLPAGSVFPFDFGFIPATRGGDGDPLDVLVLMDEPTVPGCVVPSRIVGVIEARQIEGTEDNRNDRLIAIAAKSHSYAGINSLDEINERTVGEIEHFFVSYNETKGRTFEVLGRFGPDRAMHIIEGGFKSYSSQA